MERIHVQGECILDNEISAIPVMDLDLEVEGLLHRRSLCIFRINTQIVPCPNPGEFLALFVHQTEGFQCGRHPGHEKGGTAPGCSPTGIGEGDFKVGAACISALEGGR